MLLLVMFQEAENLSSDIASLLEVRTLAVVKSRFCRHQRQDQREQDHATSNSIGVFVRASCPDSVIT
jgi:hypothetical protein